MPYQRIFEDKEEEKPRSYQPIFMRTETKVEEPDAFEYEGFKSFGPEDTVET